MDHEDQQAGEQCNPSEMSTNFPYVMRLKKHTLLSDGRIANMLYNFNGGISITAILRLISDQAKILGNQLN